MKLSLLNSVDGFGSVGAWVAWVRGCMNQILVWVVWVHKISVWVKKRTWVEILHAWRRWRKILARVWWVHKILARGKKLYRVKNNILYVPLLSIIFKVFLICIHSWHLFLCILYAHFIFTQIGVGLKLYTGLDPA